jgi:hypothetical protein
MIQTCIIDIARHCRRHQDRSRTSDFAYFAGSGAMMANEAMSRMTLIDLPEHMLSCIIRLVEQDALQPNSDADGVAALRCVCRSMRHAVNAAVTQAVFYTYVGADELDDVSHRHTGSSVLLLNCTRSTCHCAPAPVPMACAPTNGCGLNAAPVALLQIHLQACAPSNCSSSSISHTLLQPSRRLRLCHTSAPFTSREQHLTT